MKIVKILIKVLPLNSEVLVHLKNIESPDNQIACSKWYLPVVEKCYWFFFMVTNCKFSLNLSDHIYCHKIVFFHVFQYKMLHFILVDTCNMKLYLFLSFFVYWYKNKSGIDIDHDYNRYFLTSYNVVFLNDTIVLLVYMYFPYGHIGFQIDKQKNQI